MNWVKEWRAGRAASETLIRAKKRLGGLRSTDLLDYIDQSISDIGRYMTAYRAPVAKEVRDDSLYEAILSTEVLLVMLEDLRDRSASRPHSNL